VKHVSKGKRMRICMWSGPRNLSTAMMYSFGARPDCAVVDEPFYAAYLARTGLDHPMRDAVLAAQSNDPVEVGSALTGPVPGGRAYFYQKHMVHHMLPGFMPDWPADTRHVFLIRHPARVVASYAAKREAPTQSDLGFADQWRLFEDLRALGTTPLVIDSAVIRENPQAALAGLCDDLGLSFDPRMLSWPAGGHSADGVWATHWYGAVHRSTGFAGAEEPLPELQGEYRDLAEAGMAPYARLAAFGRKIAKT
jgi:hypothetical protein